MTAARRWLPLPMETAKMVAMVFWTALEVPAVHGERILQKQIDGVLVDDPWHDRWHVDTSSLLHERARVCVQA
uniref:Putative secreted protein n=1 Tax=Anopheles triannulatus TaxID=58253 RepID=A0A2M4B7M7_9DIPT